MIYADNAATTKLSPTALAAMMPYFTQEYGNPSSLYDFAGQAKAGLEQARSDVARCLNAQPGEIFFTSGGTESDNWALRGVAEALGKKGKHILISAVEHHAILHTGDWLRKQGFEVEVLPVDEYGVVRPGTLEKALRPDTILVSVMLANNEIGTIQPIQELAALAHAGGRAGIGSRPAQPLRPQVPRPPGHRGALYQAAHPHPASHPRRRAGA